MDESWVSEVVESVLSEDGGSGLEPHSRVTEVGRSVVLEELWGQASEGSQHGPTGVDDLALSVAGKGLWVRGETGRVPSVVSWVLTGEVRDLWGEWTQVLGSVWAIELHGSAGHLASGLQDKHSIHSKISFTVVRVHVRLSVEGPMDVATRNEQDLPGRHRSSIHLVSNKKQSKSQLNIDVDAYCNALDSTHPVS